ncbi:MAG: hypothetical protein ACFUZC_14285 [Chthoniobacteraceae bacterium]
MLKRIARNHKRSKAAFSLVEVTLSIGVIGFAFIPMFGLVPAGLNTFHRTMQTAVCTQIAQRIISEAQQTDFATLSQLATAGASLRCFDNEGTEILTASPLSDHRTVYAVNTLIRTPQGGIAGLKCTDMLNVVVQVANDPARKALTTGTDGMVIPAEGISIQNFSCIVAANK